MPKPTTPKEGSGPDSGSTRRRNNKGEGQGPGSRRRDRGPAGPRRQDQGPPPPPPEGVDLFVVQFKGHRKGYYHNRRKLEMKPGQYCLVEADRGRDLGRITYVGPGKAEWWVSARNQGALEAATPGDLARLHDNRGDEWEFWDICQEKIQYRKLKMNLVTVERQFDHKKITFYFTAEKRVDFRELVRDLAAVFRTRIELRQIGVRDEARLKGGLGVCGREFCCSTFLHEFVPVTLKMAKTQQLPLNPGKLSGPCGRLRCCMTYENEVYHEARRRLPRVGARIQTPDGSGTVRKLDLLAGTVSLSIQGQDGLRTWPARDLAWDRGDDAPRPRPENGGCPGKQGPRSEDGKAGH